MPLFYAHFQNQNVELVSSTLELLESLQTDFIDLPDACKILIFNDANTSNTFTNHTFLQISSKMFEECLNLCPNKPCFMAVSATMARVELDSEKLENGELRFAKIGMSDGTVRFVDRFVAKKPPDDMMACAYCGHTWDGFAQHDCPIKNMMDECSFVSQPSPTPTQ